MHATRTASVSAVHEHLPHLGRDGSSGFRNRQSGAVYLNSGTQTTTAMERRAMLSRGRFHRDTQTINVHEQSTQSRRDSCIQTNHGLLVDRACIALLPVRHEYCSASMLHDRKVRAVVLLQSIFRRALAQREFRRRARVRNAQTSAAEDEANERSELWRYKRDLQIERRKHPRTAEDFALLFNGIKLWRKQELAELRGQGLPADQEARAIQKLGRVEARMIQACCVQRTRVVADARRTRMRRWVDEMAAPKPWAVVAAGGSVLVDTPGTQRARELRQVYLELAADTADADGRLLTLLKAKAVVQAYDCALCADIVALINRESDLLGRVRDAYSLGGLRERISALFLQFLARPEFNPEAATHPPASRAVAAVAAKMRAKSYKTFKCKSCGTHQASTAFPLTAEATVIGHCAACLARMNEATERKWDAPYAGMLGAVRLAEARAEPPGIVDKFMTEGDMRHLVERFWGGRSSVSGECRHTTDLVLVRWDMGVPISPWNAILATVEEARVHLCGRAQYELYSQEFCANIAHRLEIAKGKFTRLYDLEIQHRQRQTRVGI